jgi:NAD(P)-dependent dehydrogenase (short-subunit alcohol dehydrogenase family)
MTRSDGQAGVLMKQALITGGMGGLGKVTSGYLVSRGWHVFAADVIRENAGIRQHPQITPVYTDITNETSVNDTLTFISGRTDGLDAIINLAGILVIGSVVEIPTREIERIMNINLLGSYRINKAFLPLLLKRKGRIINVSSETGWQTAAPFNGPYSMSKYALEAYSDALRRELCLLGIRVIKVQPGAFKTGLSKQVEDLFSNALKSTLLFRENISAAIDLVSNVYEKANDPERFAHIVFKSLKVRNPKTCYSVKPDRARSFLELLPVRWADRIYRRILKAGKGVK